MFGCSIGWFLSAYFLGGYADDGRGMNGLSKAVVAATKSWAAGVPVSLTPLTNPPLHTPPPLPPNPKLLVFSLCHGVYIQVSAFVLVSYAAFDSLSLQLLMSIMYL